MYTEDKFLEDFLRIWSILDNLNNYSHVKGSGVFYSISIQCVLFHKFHTSFTLNFDIACSFWRTTIFPWLVYIGNGLLFYTLYIHTSDKSLLLFMIPIFVYENRHTSSCMKLYLSNNCAALNRCFQIFQPKAWN